MVRKSPKYYDGKLIGKRLTEDDCRVLDKLRDLSNTGGYVRDLKKCIYDLSPLDVEVIKATGNNDTVELKTGTLSNPQTLGVAYMFYAKRVIITDSVGMGKTVEACALFNLLAQKMRKEGYEFRFLYLTEKNLVNECRDKLIRFTGEYVGSCFGDKKTVLNFVDENQEELKYSLVASHSIVKNVMFQEFINRFKMYFDDVPFDILVIDEAGSVLGNNKSQIYENMKTLADMFELVILMNATPFEKDLTMMYNQLDFVDDSLLPSRTEFNKRYVDYDYRGPYPKPSGKYKNADEFKRLTSYRTWGMTRMSTGAKMEDCTADVIISDLSSVQKELLKRTSIPNMVFDCPGYFMGDVNESTTENTPKMRDLLGLVTKFVDDGESVLIFSLYKEAQFAIKSMLVSHGIDCEIMNGATNIKEKNNLINDFKLGALKVLITNVQKGLDFGRCNICIFYSYDPSPNKMVQFEGRMTRDHDIIGKHIYILISRGKELNRFKGMVRDRAVASDMFSGSDFSCVMQLLLDEERIEKLK